MKTSDIITHSDFDTGLVESCAQTFTTATGLGCTVSDTQGSILYACGYSCDFCKLCTIAGSPKENCVQSHIYGMTSAERFGGKYIYFCPLGLACFVSPIIGVEGTKAKITVGPFLMVDPQDFVQCDLRDERLMSENIIAVLEKELIDIPVAYPERVNALSSLLFMVSTFLNDASSVERMLKVQQSELIQGQIAPYVMRLKSESDNPSYPYNKEKELLRAVVRSDKQEARKILNELLGYIFFAAGGNIITTKARIYELIILINRSAIETGVNVEKSLQDSSSYFEIIQQFKTIDDLSIWLFTTMEKIVDSVFKYSEEKHAHIIRKTISYLNENYNKKITLEDVAKRIYLSPVYFSRIFKQETGTTFIHVLNTIRIERSCELIWTDRYRLTDIALMCGFEDQSYFTKVFKRVMGISPMQYKIQFHDAK